jgi:hypothetical protein
MLLNCGWLIRQLTQRDQKVILLHVLSKRIIHNIDTKDIFVPRQRCFYGSQKKNSVYFSIQHRLIDFRNRYGGCLLRGTC